MRRFSISRDPPERLQTATGFAAAGSTLTCPPVGRRARVARWKPPSRVHSAGFREESSSRSQPVGVINRLSAAEKPPLENFLTKLDQLKLTFSCLMRLLGPIAVSD